MESREFKGMNKPEMVIAEKYHTSDFDRARLEFMMDSEKEIHLFLEGKKYFIYKIIHPMPVRECKNFLLARKTIPIDEEKMDTVLSQDIEFEKFPGTEFPHGNGKDIFFIGLDESLSLSLFVFEERRVPDWYSNVRKVETFQADEIISPEKIQTQLVFALASE